MPTPLDLVEAEAMKLSPQERADLADRLWHSVHSAEEVGAAWAEEIANRAHQVDAGEVTCRPWEQVMIEMRAKYG